MLVGETTFAGEGSFVRENDGTVIWRPTNASAITLYGAADHLGHWLSVYVPAEESGTNPAARRLLNDAAAAGLVARVG